MRFIATIASGVVLLACQARAQTPATVFLEDLTWTEVSDALAAGTTTVIIPTGGTEQNGPHMVLGKHNVLVKHKAGEVAGRLGNALVAPVMAYVPEGDIDPPTGHMRFPGTITTPPDVFEQVLEHAARSFKQTAFWTSRYWATAVGIRTPRLRWPSVSTSNGRRHRSVFIT